MDHLTNHQKKQFLTDEFARISQGHETLDRDKAGTYSYNHNNRTIIFLLALLLDKLAFNSHDTQVFDLLNDSYRYDL